MADKPELTFGARYGRYFALAWLAFWAGLIAANWLKLVR
jgi:hypothetical protein